MADLNDAMKRQRALAEAPTLGNLHPDARAQATARAGIADLTAADVRAQLQRMADAAGSQKSLARALNVSEQYLSDVLLGRREIGPAITEMLGLDVVVTFRPRGVLEVVSAAPPSVAPSITDDMALAFHRATTDGDIGQEDVDTIKAGLRAVFAACGVRVSSEGQQ